MLGRFAQALGATGHRPYLTGQTNLAKGHQIHRQRLIAQTGHHRQHNREIGAGLTDAHTTDDVGVHIHAGGRHTTMTIQHREQHRQPILIDADRNAARIAELRFIDQRLHFDQQGPRTFARDHHHRARHRLTVT